MKKIVLLLLALTPVCLPAQHRYDVLITEIMADPSPQVGLPKPSFTLQPDSFLIVCNSSGVTAMSVWGTCTPVTSFPSLDNDGDQLYLRALNGSIMHAVSYQSD